jgi:hypothetical protein
VFIDIASRNLYLVEPGDVITTDQARQALEPLLDAARTN